MTFSAMVGGAVVPVALESWGTALGSGCTGNITMTTMMGALMSGDRNGPESSHSQLVQIQATSVVVWYGAPSCDIYGEPWRRRISLRAYISQSEDNGIGCRGQPLHFHTHHLQEGYR